MRVRILKETRDLPVGRERFDVIARDWAVRMNHHFRNTLASFQNDALVWQNQNLRFKAQRQPDDRLRVEAWARLPRGWRKLRHRNHTAAGLRYLLDDLFGRTYTKYPRKVFGVGFQRTGTTSMAAALRQLGFFCLDAAPWLLDDLVRGNYALSVFQEYDAFTDNPFPALFKELDRHFPDSRFILTTRDTDSWLDSVRALVEALPGYEMEKWLYGCDHFDRDAYRERFERHNREVLDYFRDRPESLLVMDLKSTDGWKNLCGFLDLPIPDVAFPHLNRRSRSVSM